MTALPDPLAAFAPLLDALADRVVDRWLASTSTRMVAQRGSPLGPRRHRAAVERRMKNGEGGAAIVGKRHYYLTHQALQEELGVQPPPSDSPHEPEPSSDDDSGGGPPRDRVSAFRAELLGKLRGTGGGK
jgi:hypothetical protein